MSIATTYAKLCALNATATGINYAPTNVPMVINESELPIAITEAGPATWNEHANGLYRQFRTYTIRVYVKPIGQGIGDEGYQNSLPILDALGSIYVRNPTLDSTVDHIGDMGEFSDSGIVLMDFGEMKYYGFTITLNVTEKST